MHPDTPLCLELQRGHFVVQNERESDYCFFFT
uniref:Uncharacterized protein n=1 Tax=Arundo donax TaxID=35708 RepID=A0A0A9FE69_ARUDO